jgi:integrase
MSAGDELSRTIESGVQPRWALDRLRSAGSWLVFTTPAGRAIDPRGLTRMLTVLCRNAHVRSVRVHDLRHTAASLMLAEGVAVRALMETLGHANISMTMDTYGHVMETTRRDAADRMDKALSATIETPDTSEGDEDDRPQQGLSFAVDVSY